MKDLRVAVLTLGPGTLYLAAFLGVPLLIVLAYALGVLPEGGASVRHFRDLLDSAYLAVLGRSLRLAAFTTVVCLALGYPVAWAIAGLERRRRLLPLLLLVVPSWINLLVKNYAWIVILRREGVVNGVLLRLGVVDEPLTLLFTEGAVLVGLVHSYLVFMVLPIYAAVDRVDPALIDAARDLGASGRRLFMSVVLPQTAAGVIVGCVFVFVLALGSFVTPDLLGGARGMMIGNLIQNQILQVRNWPVGAALAVTLVVLVLGAVVAFVRLAGRVGGERIL